MADFPRVDRFYVLYALNAIQMNDDQEAELKCRELLKINPLFSSAHIILGEISIRKKQIPAAISYFRRALEIEPQNILLKIKYTELLTSQEDYVSAMTAYEELLENEDVQRDSGLLFKIGLYTAKYGKLEKAEELMRRAIELEPRGRYYFDYALVLAKNDKMEDALKNMEMGLSQPGNELSAEQRQIAQKAIQMWKR
jgi:Tfp pilus assembly protein PilF